MFMVIATTSRERARRWFVEPLYRHVQPKVVAANAGITAAEWSRMAHGGQNVAGEVVAAQPREAVIDVALAILVDVQAIPSPTALALKHAERVLRRKQMARGQLVAKQRSA